MAIVFRDAQCFADKLRKSPGLGRNLTHAQASHYRYVTANVSFRRRRIEEDVAVARTDSEKWCSDQGGRVRVKCLSVREIASSRISSKLIEARGSVMSGRRLIHEDIDRDDAFWWPGSLRPAVECREWAVSRYRSFGFRWTTATAVVPAVVARRGVQFPYCWFRRATFRGDGILGFAGEYT